MEKYDITIDRKIQYLWWNQRLRNCQVF